MAIEKVLDGFRREGISEGDIRTALERAWRASVDLEAVLRRSPVRYQVAD